MNVKFILLFFIPLICLYSCSSSKDIARYNEQMKKNRAVHLQNLTGLNRADSMRIEKYKAGLLDIISNQRLELFIDSLKTVTLRHLRDDSIILSQKVRHSNVEFYLLISERISREAVEQKSNVDFVNTLLATNTFTEFSVSSLFASGQYIFSESGKQAAISTFSPVIDSILSFTSRFPARKLTATVILLGFADAQPINPASELAATLVKKMGKQTAESPELNRELSRLRAGSVRQILNEIVASKKSGNLLYRFLSMDYVFQGRGEELPDEKINDYKTDDERRRVVKVFWSVIPYL